jgi:hypothetical protein
MKHVWVMLVSGAFLQGLLDGVNFAHTAIEYA